MVISSSIFVTSHFDRLVDAPLGHCSLLSFRTAVRTSRLSSRSELAEGHTDGLKTSDIFYSLALYRVCLLFSSFTHFWHPWAIFYTEWRNNATLKKAVTVPRDAPLLEIGSTDV
jgi:hypothetical protein